MMGEDGRIVPAEIRDYLHEHIPISAAMQVDVEEASSSGVRLSAPLEPNINHRSTVFGGSASALAILAGWTFVHVRLGHAGHSEHRSRIVIQNSYVHYDAPIDGAFVAIADAPPEEVWERFTTMLRRRGRARIEIDVRLELDGEPVGRMKGAYVVVPESGELAK